MAVEHAPPGKRGFYGSWPQIGVPAGLLLSTAVFAVFSRLPEEQFLAWGWRVPFLLSIAAGRRRAGDPRADPRDAGVRAGQGGIAAKRGSRSSRCSATYPKQVLLAMGARFAENGAFYIYSVFVLAYATQHVKMPQQIVLNGILIGAALELLAIPFFGALSDRVGRRPVYLFGAIVDRPVGVPAVLAARHRRRRRSCGSR